MGASPRRRPPPPQLVLCLPLALVVCLCGSGSVAVATPKRVDGSSGLYADAGVTTPALIPPPTAKDGKVNEIELAIVQGDILQIQRRTQSRKSHTDAGVTTAALTPRTTAKDAEGDVIERVIVQGDIMQIRRRTPPQKVRRAADLTRTKRMIISDGYAYSGYAKWPYGIVPYTIDNTTYSAAGYQQVTQMVTAAMSDWSSNTCVRFIPAGAQAQALVQHSAYVRIYGGYSCWSIIGFGGDGNAQGLSLAESGCLARGLAAHELGHTLGLVHQQSRPDRDGYMMVIAKNVRVGQASNFVKTPYPSALVPTPYDHYSIMNYGSSDFSANGKATLVPKIPRLVNLLGNRQQISFYDYKAVNILYNCSGGCTLPCKNDGYPLQRANGTCTCICPYGLGGQLCDTVQLPCGGGVIALSANGTPALISSPNNPGKYPTGVVCGWLIKAPPGYVVKLTFTSFNVSASPWQCNHSVDIRSNLIAQPAPTRYCGVGLPDPVYSRYDPSASAILVLLNATANGTVASSGFTAVASAYIDGCLSDPCRGAPCSSAAGSSTFACQPRGDNFICGFENVLSTNCSSVRFDSAYTLFNGSGSPQMSWELFETNADLAAVDGSQYAGTKATDHGADALKGYFRIVPFAFAASGRCLRFSYVATGSLAGSLNVYRAVNGALGQPIFSTSGSQSGTGAWYNASLQIASTSSPLDLIEIVFEAVHDLDQIGDTELIGVDGLRYSAGPCPTGPCAQDPCGTAPCTVLSPTSYSCAPAAVAATYDAACDFESWEDCSAWLNYVVSGDNYDWVKYSWPAPGVQWPRGTGAPGPAGGLTYLYGQLYDKAAGSKIWLRVYPFFGSRCLRFKYNMYGLDIATLTVYRAIGGVYPGATKLWSVTGNQGGGWRSAAVSVDNSAFGSSTPVELTVEVVRGSTGYASDYGLDGFSYKSGLCV